MFCRVLISTFPPNSLNLHTYGQYVVIILHLGMGLSFCGTGQRYAPDCYVSPFERNRLISTELLFKVSSLAAFPLVLHSITSLTSNCLNLFFGTQGSIETKTFSINKKIEDTRRLFIWEAL